MSKHTPGPWSINNPSTREVVADYGGNDIGIALGIRTPADAHLIAAAPDLLAALKELLPRFENLRELAGFDEESNVAVAASAAIAKAEGR